MTIARQGYSSVTLALSVTADQTTTGDAVLVPAVTPGNGALAGMVWLKLDDGTQYPLQGALLQLIAGGGIVSPGIQQPPVTQARGSKRAGTAPTAPGYYTFSAQDGSYSLVGITPGTYQAIVSYPGLNTVNVTVSITANVTAHLDCSLTLMAVQFGTIQGTVTDSSSTLPIANANVLAIITPPSAGTNSPAPPPAPSSRRMLRSVRCRPRPMGTVPINCACRVP